MSPSLLQPSGTPSPGGQAQKSPLCSFLGLSQLLLGWSKVPRGWLRWGHPLAPCGPLHPRPPLHPSPWEQSSWPASGPCPTPKHLNGMQDSAARGAPAPAGSPGRPAAHTGAHTQEPEEEARVGLSLLVSRQVVGESGHRGAAGEGGVCSCRHSNPAAGRIDSRSREGQGGPGGARQQPRSQQS